MYSNVQVNIRHGNPAAPPPTHPPPHLITYVIIVNECVIHLLAILRYVISQFDKLLLHLVAVLKAVQPTVVVVPAKQCTL